MITLLFKIIHFEASQEHEDNILRTFYLIWVLLSCLPVALVYLIYTTLAIKNNYSELIFYGIELGIIGYIYYSMVVRRAKIFVETNVGWQYYNFGTYNIVLKTLAFLLLFALVVLVGRVIFLFK